MFLCNDPKTWEDSIRFQKTCKKVGPKPLRCIGNDDKSKLSYFVLEQKEKYSVSISTLSATPIFLFHDLRNTFGKKNIYI